MTLRALIALFVFFAIPAAHAGPAMDGDLVNAEKTVAQFLKVPAEHMFCSDRGLPWEPGGDGEKVLPEMAHFLSAEMLRLFGWIHCGTPEYPTPSMRESNKYYWDFRYGLRQSESDSEPSRVRNLRILSPRMGANQNINITTLFNFYSAGNADLVTTYSLVYENGQWKIDDIALKGYVIDMGTMGKEPLLPSSKSLKTELQAAYKRAETKCLQDPQCRVKLSK